MKNFLNIILKCALSFILTSLLYTAFLGRYIDFSLSFSISFGLYFFVFIFWINIEKGLFQYYAIALVFWFSAMTVGMFINPKTVSIFVLPIICSISLAYVVVVALKKRKTILLFSCGVLSLVSISLYSLYFLPLMLFSEGVKVVKNEYRSYDVLKDDKLIYTLNAKGDTVRFNDIKNKMVYLEFWFIECSPCIKKMPSLQKLKETYKGNKKINFISVITGEANSFDEFKLSAKKYGRGFDSYLYAPSNVMAHMRKVIDIKGFPQEYIYVDGAIIASHTGFEIAEESFYLRNRKSLINKHLKL